MNIYPGLNVTEYVKDLHESGLNKEISEAVVRVVSGLSFDVVDSKHLATKSDLLIGMKDIRAELKDLENRLLLKIGGIMMASIALISFIKG